MPSPGRLVAFAATRDLARAQRFYTEQLGLTLVEANPGAVVLDSDGVQLRVTLSSRRRPRRRTPCWAGTWTT